MTGDLGALIIERVDARIDGVDEADTIFVCAYLAPDSGGGTFTWEIPLQVFLRAAHRFDSAGAPALVPHAKVP